MSNKNNAYAIGQDLVNFAENNWMIQAKWLFLTNQRWLFQHGTATRICRWHYHHHHQNAFHATPDLNKNVLIKMWAKVGEGKQTNKQERFKFQSSSKRM